MKKDTKLVSLSVVLLLPAFLLVAGGLAQSVFGITSINDLLNVNLFFFHPLSVISGTILAFAMNLFSITRISYDDGVLTTTLVLKNKLLQMGVLLTCSLFALIIFAYLMAENFGVFQF